MFYRQLQLGTQTNDKGDSQPSAYSHMQPPTYDTLISYVLYEALI